MHCTYDPATRGGNAPDGRKVKSTIHWVSAAHAVDAEVRVYENLFTKEDPGELEEGQDALEPESELARGNLTAQAGTIACECRGRQPLPVRAPGIFLRRSRLEGGKPVFNRTVALKDAWAKVEKKQGKG